MKTLLRQVGAALLVALGGPLVGFGWYVRGWVLAPPWIQFTGLPYLMVLGLFLPLAVLALIRGWITGKAWIAVLLLAVMAACLYLPLVGIWLPNGETVCHLVEQVGSQVHYACVATSSDNADYRYTFEVWGRAGWPVMRLTNPHLVWP